MEAFLVILIALSFVIITVILAKYFASKTISECNAKKPQVILRNADGSASVIGTVISVEMSASKKDPVNDEIISTDHLIDISILKKNAGIKL
jgi:hypothetical protein